MDRKVNLFTTPPTNAYIVANRGVWTGKKEYKPNDGLYLTRPLLETLKSERGGWPSRIQDLLADLYFALYGEEKHKGYISRMMDEEPIVSVWQWNIFEEIKLRTSVGGRDYAVIEELKNRVAVIPNYFSINDANPNSLYNQMWRRVRIEVLEFYKGECAICGRNFKDDRVKIHVDHIIPKSHTPQLALYFSNLQLLCEECNVGKGHNYSTDWRSTIHSNTPTLIKWYGSAKCPPYVEDDFSIIEEDNFVEYLKRQSCK